MSFVYYDECWNTLIVCRLIKFIFPFLMRLSNRRKIDHLHSRSRRSCGLTSLV